MSSDPETVTYNAILDYARSNGCNAAYGLLLLYGPDRFAGNYEEYNELLYLLNNHKIPAADE